MNVQTTFVVGLSEPQRFRLTVQPFKDDPQRLGDRGLTCEGGEVDATLGQGERVILDARVARLAIASQTGAFGIEDLRVQGLLIKAVSWSPT